MSTYNPRALVIGAKILSRGIFNKPSKKYAGSPKEIGLQIIRSCWNGQYFQASSGHFSQFWIRDFSLNARSLIRLGFSAQVEKTLRYALGRYFRRGRIATTIIGGVPVDITTYAPDSLALLLYILRQTKNSNLAKKYKNFLENELERFWKIVIDPQTDLVRRHRFFASMQDTIKRDSSCYDNIMVGLAAKEAAALGLRCPFGFSHERFMKRYWTGESFKDDQSGLRYTSSDAHLYAVWSDVIPDQHINQKAIGVINEKKNDDPFPMIFTRTPIRFSRSLTSLLTPNYQGSTIWTLSGGVYLQILKKYNPVLFKKHLESYTKLIQKHQNFFEIYTPNGQPYKTFFYKADEGMLWVANYLAAL